jgi:formylglycine-generating enzyme required for sulfatase activity
VSEELKGKVGENRRSGGSCHASPDGGTGQKTCALRGEVAKINALQKRSEPFRRYPMRKLFLLICCLTTLLQPPTCLTQSQTDRGGDVRVRERDGGTRTVELYKHSYALLIGNSDYTTWRDLPGVRNDMNDVKAALKRQGFSVVKFDGKGDPVFDEPALNLTRGEFMRQVELFIDQYGQDTFNRLLIYYAGHGYTALLSDYRKMGYLVMRDAPQMPPVEDALEHPLSSERLTSFRRASVNMDEIETFAKNITSYHALFVFDSCFAGTVLFRDGEVGVPAYIGPEVIQPVRQFLTAGNELQRVPDDSNFRKAFVRGIEGAADTTDGDNPRDGYVLASELYAYIKKEVSKYSNLTPVLGKIPKQELARGDFIFIPGIRAIAQAVPPPSSPLPSLPNMKTGESVFWERIQKSTDPSDFEQFLAAYPNGIYAATAKFMQKKLRSTAEMSRYKNPKQGMTMRRQVTSGVDMEFIGIPAGEFLMGLPDEKDRRYNEAPQRKVTIKEGFWMGKYEVTERQWKAVMKSSPSFLEACADCPVNSAKWLEVQQFIQKLNERNDGFEYRLPSEAEWEYAARADTKTRFYWGDDSTYSLICFYANVYDEKFGEGSELTLIGDRANCNDGYAEIAPVGKFQANSFGLYDMIGNAREWCQDIYSRDYKNLPQDGTANLSEGDSSRRVVRGGSYISGAGRHSELGSAKRSFDSIEPSLGAGFRLVAVARIQ